MPTRPNSTSVVIVNYRTPELTEKTVLSAFEDAATQVVVVDNASGDDSVDRLRAIRDERLLVVASPRNGGFGSGANQGAALATGDTLIFLNSDATLRPGALAAMASEVDAAGGRALVGPRLVGVDGVVQRSAGLVPKPDDLLVRGLGLHRLADVIGRLPGGAAVVGSTRMAAEYDQAVTATTVIDVSMVSGACVTVGREAFSQLGRFDEHYFMYFEDADLCRRATRAGWPIRYLPAAVVDHVGGASAPGDYRFGPWHAASMVRYLGRWHGPAGMVTGLLILWLRAVGGAVLLQPDAGRRLAALRAGLAAARALSR